MEMMIGFPALVLLLTGGEMLPSSSRWNFGAFTKPIYVVSVAYSILVIIVAVVSTFSQKENHKLTDYKDAAVPSSHNLEHELHHSGHGRFFHYYGLGVGI